MLRGALSLLVTSPPNPHPIAAVSSSPPCQCDSHPDLYPLGSSANQAGLSKTHTLPSPLQDRAV